MNSSDPSPVSRLRSPVPTLPSIIAAALVLALYLAWARFADPPPAEAAWTGCLTLAFAGLVGAFLAWQAGGPWRRVALGLALWSAVDLLRLAGLLLPPAAEWLTILGNVLSLASAALVLAGILLSPRQARANIGRMRLLADCAITTAAALTLVWMALFSPASPTAVAIPRSIDPLLPPFADLLLLLALLNLFIITRPGAFPRSLAWLAAGLVGYTISDLAYTIALAPAAGPGLAREAFIPNSPANFGWIAGDLLIVVAAVLASRSQAFEPPQPSGALLERTIARIQSLLPLVITVVLGWYTIIDMQLQGRSNPLGLWMTVVLALALIGRQGILTGEVEFQQYASLVDSIAEPAFICNRKGELQLVNPAFLAICGFQQPAQLTRQPLDSLIEHDQPLSVVLDSAIKDGWTGEVALHTRQDGNVPVLLSLRPLAWGRQNTLALAGTAHNLTEIKRQQAELMRALEEVNAAHQAQEQLNAELEQRVLEKTADLSQAYEQLERQNAALLTLDQLKSDFISMVSHELRAPLTNIHSGIELVLSRSRSLAPAAQETLDLVQGETRRLTGFIETILDLSALDAGRAPIYPAPLELNKAIQAIQRQMTHLPGVERIRWNVPASLPEFIADERAVVSVLFHLLDNALKYAPAGEITVSAGVEGEHGWIAVADQGKGIPEEDLPMLFTRFFRSQQSDAQTVYGHGLGLYIAHRLAAAMDGRITVENRPEGGAKFTCWLPLAADESEGGDGLDDPGS